MINSESADRPAPSQARGGAGRALRVAVLIPCYNEESAIGEVVRGFRDALPDAAVYVYDNNSTDATVEQAATAGAVVRREPSQGKGNVVRRMFADVEADVYVMVDGDGTYDAASSPAMVEALVRGQLDMVVGTRLHAGKAEFRLGHHFGNQMLTGFVGVLFGSAVTDMLSGYRVMSRRFVKSFPALASGFETETELTVHARSLRMPTVEMATPFANRSGESESKLNTVRDGLRILKMVLYLLKEIRPLMFFTCIFAVLSAVSIGLGVPIVEEYLETGLVPRFPTAILAASIMVVAFLSLTCGIILDSVKGARWEAKRLAYLALPRVGGGGDEV